MPTARLITVGSSDAMESVEGNDSLYTLISQATGKEPIVLGDKPIQWIQLLHALEQPGVKLTILSIGRLLCSALFCLVARSAGEEDGVPVTLVPDLEVGKGRGVQNPNYPKNPTGPRTEFAQPKPTEPEMLWTEPATKRRRLIGVRVGGINSQPTRPKIRLKLRVAYVCKGATSFGHSIYIYIYIYI
nr:uncharacterized protein LOC109173008 isoform X3 [Ipomoea batatas]